MSTKIKDIKAYEIIDSRGFPTVEAVIRLAGGVTARAAVPSGASTGANEALELRDGDSSRFGGKGVLKAVANVNGPIAKALAGVDACDQAAVDAAMLALDSTPNKATIGANAMLAASLAAARAAARSKGIPLYRHLAAIGKQDTVVLPVPMMNIINGGSHSDAPIAFQEFMIRPHGFSTFREALRSGSEIFQALKGLLKKRNFSTSVGDEGGFAPPFASTEDAIETILAAIKRAGYKAGRAEEGGQVSLALDCAASEFYVDGMYDYGKFETAARGATGTPAKRDSAAQIDYLCELIEKYPIDSIEDGMDENDWTGWIQLTKRIGKQCQIVGDDLFVTNVDFVRRGIAEKAANSVLVKVNQIGTLTETLATMAMATAAGFTNVVSHRSGETEDTFIADLAVGTAAGQIKTGSISRSDRVAKYNRLLRIEDELGVAARYAGSRA